jgi:hypothetical protein
MTRDLKGGTLHSFWDTIYKLCKGRNNT